MVLSAAEAHAASYVLDFNRLGEVMSSFGDSVEADVSRRSIESLAANAAWVGAPLTTGTINF
jgi:hypothetical protein